MVVVIGINYSNLFMIALDYVVVDWDTCFFLIQITKKRINFDKIHFILFCFFFIENTFLFCTFYDYFVIKMKHEITSRDDKGEKH